MINICFKDENKSEHFKKIKKAERDILLQNIRSLPDMPETNDEETKENGEHLLSVAVNSPNPSFLVLDKDVLESFSIDSDQIRSDSVGLVDEGKNTENSPNSQARPVNPKTSESEA